jgi:hypothetical protein
VFVPYFNAQVDVVSQDLFVTGEIDESGVLGEARTDIPMCEVQFDGDLTADNEIIDGAYRLPGRGWDRFVFQKFEQSHPSYQLRMPVSGGRIGPAVLCYNVPGKDRLNRAYVLRALAEIIGIEEWT